MTIEFKPLAASDVEVRVGSCTDRGCSLLLYKDARVDMRMLDAAVGPEAWQCRYEQISDTLYCSVGINTGEQWVWKQDCGTPSQMEGEKGCASDAFKRACFKWGIGRELYTAPFIWVPSDKCNIGPGRNGKPACRDRFRVDWMKVEDGRITALSVRNDSRSAAVFRLGGDALIGTCPACGRRYEFQDAGQMAETACACGNRGFGAA